MSGLSFNGGHLYQYLTVLGVILASFSTNSLSSVWVHHTRTFENIAPRIVNGQGTSDLEAKMWRGYLDTQNSNLDYIVISLFISTIFGVIIAVAGAVLWWFNIQCLEDKKRTLEVEEAIERLKASRNEKKILT